MPPRITQKSYRLRVSDRTMVGTLPSGYCFQGVRAEPPIRTTDYDMRVFGGMGKSIERKKNRGTKRARARFCPQPFDEFPVGYSWAGCSPAGRTAIPGGDSRASWREGASRARRRIQWCYLPWCLDLLGYPRHTARFLSVRWHQLRFSAVGSDHRDCGSKGARPPGIPHRSHLPDCQAHRRCEPGASCFVARYHQRHQLFT